MISKFFLLDFGGTLRIDILGSSCVRLRLNTEGDVWHESGLNRYGILDEARLDDGTKAIFHGKTISLAGGCKLKLEDGGRISISHGVKKVTSITRIERRRQGGFNVAFALNDNEKLYGLGDENRDSIQKRGHRAEMVVINVRSYIPIPYLMSTGGWAVLMNTTCHHIADVGAKKTDELTFECAYGTPDLYIFLNDTMPGLLELYTRLAGRPVLLPRWAYGFTFVCDEREVRARDVLYEAFEFRRQELPCDVIGLEPDWMEKHYDFSTEKQWSEKRFHIPFWLKKNGNGTFAGTLHKMGFHLSLWLCCDYDLSEYEEMLIGGGRDALAYTGGNMGGDAAPTEEGQHEHSADDIIHDEHLECACCFDKITKRGEPWFHHLRKFVDDGADAFKLDGANQVLFHPDRRWYNGMQDFEMHNLYPVIYGKQMANGFIEHTGRRAMIYTSGGYAGIQQYAATWTGDTGGGPRALCGLLNLAMSGHSNGTNDMQIWDRQGIHSAMLLPWTQLLGWHMYTEPWFQGKDILDCFKFYAKLRYRLLPYIYATAWQAHCTGLPMMRPLPLVFPDDSACDNITNEYMLGDSLLVASFGNRIYLPEGTWYNYWTKKPLAGGCWLDVSDPSEWGDGTQPLGGALFVRAGALIPTAPDMLYSQEKPLDDLTWEVYAVKGGNSFTLFDDDGTTFAFDDGKYVATMLSACFDGSELVLEVNILHNGAPELTAKRNNHFVLYGFPDNVKVIEKDG